MRPMFLFVLMTLTFQVSGCGEKNDSTNQPKPDNMCAPYEYADIECGPTNTYYVATTGNDSNPGSQDEPWNHINHAVGETGPGDCVYVRSGTYDEGSEIWIRESDGGAEGAWWSLEAYPGETVQLETRIIVEGSYVRIRGFHMARERGIITSWSGQHKEILDNHFTGFYRYAPLSVGFDHCLVEGNVIELDGSGSTTDHGIYVMHGSHNIIRNNFIRNPHGYGIHIYDEDKYDHSPDISDMLIECNFVSSSAERSGMIVASSNNVNISDIVIRRNVIVDNSGHGIVLNYSDRNRVRNISILNNTIVGNTSGGISISDMNTVLVHNNIIVNEGAGNSLSVSNSTGVVVDTNLYWPENPTLVGIDDPGMITGDPLFVDAWLGDYHLDDGSPAIDTGIDVGLAYEGEAPDIGAFEKTN